MNGLFEYAFFVSLLIFFCHAGVERDAKEGPGDDELGAPGGGSVGGDDKLPVGTPAYFSPEMISRDEPQGPRADWWACGCFAFEVCFGRAPFVPSLCSF